MTQPAPPFLDTDEQLSGRTVEAVADLHDELQRRYTGLNTAEARLAEALLTAHAASEAGQRRLQDIQQQLVEAINSPVNALDTPAGERQFLLFLRSKIAEIRRVVDDGALAAHDQSEVTSALANDYLSPDDQPVVPPSANPPPAFASPGPQAVPTPPGLSGFPSSPPAMPSGSGLSGATAPLSDLASLFTGDHLVPRSDDADANGEVGRPRDEEHNDEHNQHDGHDDGHDKHQDEPKDRDGAHDGDDQDDLHHRDDDAHPADPDDAPPGDSGPAETRPADR
ncbi:MAG: hypothetical protein QOH57_3363 [Mycobacterium sp.]|jgi:hypothetical protein|nr:hypothetical protein [Mycobacterium sp.]